MNIRKYAQGQASTLLRRLAFQMRATAESGDPDSVHDLRVAIRRFTQCLRVFRQFFPRGEVNKIRRNLASIMDACGEVRNRDIALELAAKADDAAHPKLAPTFTRQREQEQHKLLTAVRHWMARDLSQKWRAKLELWNMRWKVSKSESASAMAELPLLAVEYFAEGRKRVSTRNLRPAALHKFRLATKRFRYTVELFQSCYGPGLDERLKRLREIQDLLGKINDCATTIDLLGRGHGKITSYLERRIEKKAAELREYWRNTFDAPGQERWWTAYLSRSSAPNRARKQAAAS